MSDSLIEILFDEDRSVYLPGETLAGKFLVTFDNPDDLKAVEVSILWYSEGKGDEDIGVHHFERLDAQDGAATNLRRPVSFSTVLPNSPLSYVGAIVKIVWCVRVRAFPQRGDDYMVEERFQLGDIPAPDPAATNTAPTGS